MFFVPLVSPKPSTKLHNRPTLLEEQYFITKIHRKEGKKTVLLTAKWLYVKTQEFSREHIAILLSHAGFLLFQMDSELHIFLSPPHPPTPDDSIWQELLI